MPPEAAPAPASASAPADPTDAAQRDVLDALALGAVPRAPGWLAECLIYLGAREPAGHRYTPARVQALLARLQEAGWMAPATRRPGHWAILPAHAGVALARTLARHAAAALRQALEGADAPHVDAWGQGARLQHRLPTVEAAIARVRLEAGLGAAPDALAAWQARLPWNAPWEAVLQAAVTDAVDEALFPHLHPQLQADLLAQGLEALHRAWQAPLALPLAELAAQRLAHDATAATTALRLRLAEHLVLAGRAAELPALLAPLQAQPDALAQARAAALLAAVPAAAGRWAEASAAADAALAALRKLTGKRRGLLPAAIATPYVLSLLAQGTPAHLAQALKFCLAEGGRREPEPDSPFGLMALAIQVRNGALRRDAARWRPASHGGHVSTLDWWRWLMRAWLKEGHAPEPLSPAEADAAQRLQQRLAHVGLHGLQAQLEAALQVLGGDAAPAGFFVGRVQEGWQVALDALRAVAQPAAVAAPRAARAAPATRLLWLLALDAHGRPAALRPHEQQSGSRGWTKPKPVPLLRLQRQAEALPPHDAAVARAIRQEAHGRQLRIDLAAALAALVDHPALAFDDAPEQPVALRPAGPELEVLDEGERLRVRMHPGLPAAGEAPRPWDAAARREHEALQACCVLRDGPGRARLVVLSPAQQRVAQLLGPAGLEIPREGAAQLQQVLQDLGTQFQIHADAAATALPAPALPAEPRLRAELTPVGEGLQLRLVAAPFGAEYAADGPRLVPGSGRAQLVAHLRGQTLGVQRDLARERAHLQTVLDACPMLLEPPPGAPCEWTLDEPEQALALVERLHPLNAVAALDWPQGRPLRVQPVGLGALQVRLRSHQDWLELQGELAVDEQLVLGVKQLLALAAARKSRYLPLGEGRYLALTQELRTRLDELAAVAVAGRDDSLRLSGAAAGWLDEALQGAQVQQDRATAERIHRLARARDLQPALPGTLQATLRPYQEDGYAWAMRLAEAGLGACLADDMGLGKTLQALAVLAARAAGGAALVVAPTSLMGNWAAEARRFAPALTVHVYAEGEREALLAQAGAHDLVLVSYQLLQQDAARLARPRWHTLVLDEAQAIKNAAAKRSQAVFELQADFRLALSGTPIENRLGELWSIMQAVNPGLLGTPARFNERFVGLIERQKDRAAQRTLRRLIAPFILRRTKAQVLDDLPPRTELVLQVVPEPHERAHYEALRREALEAAQQSLSGDAPGQAQLNVLAQLTRLRRAACDPRLVSLGLQWRGAKVQAFAELAAELVANGHKALVFSQFVDFLALLREPLHAAGIAHQYLDGSTPAAERTRRVAAFQAGEGELFLISLKAGGFGLNLTVADYVVIADPWWNPAAEDQATGRAHRIGQQRPVTVYRLVNEGTLEARILELHHDKRELADRVLEGADADAPPGAIPAPEVLLRLMRGQEG